MLYNPFPIMYTDTDRERGMLSDADRAYLLGEATMTHEQSKRNAEARIRRRVRNAILDFDLLLHTLSTKDRRQLFEDVHDETEFLDALRAMVAFTYLGTREQGLAFDEVLVPAVRSSEEAYAAKRHGSNVSVEVAFDVETTVEATLDGLADRIEAGEPITPRQLFTLVVEGDRDLREYDEIALVRADDGVDDEFLERLATYLEAEVDHVTPSRAIIR